MRIDFDDGGYVEFTHSSKSNKVFIVVAAPSGNFDKIVNSAEITRAQLEQLAGSVAISLPKKRATKKKPTKKKTAKKPVEDDKN